MDVIASSFKDKIGLSARLKKTRTKKRKASRRKLSKYAWKLFKNHEREIQY